MCEKGGRKEHDKEKTCHEVGIACPEKRFVLHFFCLYRVESCSLFNYWVLFLAVFSDFE